MNPDPGGQPDNPSQITSGFVNPAASPDEERHLPHTAATLWRRVGIGVVVVVAIAAAYFLNMTRSKQTDAAQDQAHRGVSTIPFSLHPPRPTTSPSPPTEIDTPPHYPGIKWVDNGIMELGFETTTGTKIIPNAHHVESEALQNEPDDFLQYYRRRLESAGWQMTRHYRDASIEDYTYQKSYRYIKFGWTIPFGPLQYRAYFEYN